MLELLDLLVAWVVAPLTMLGVSAAYYFASPSGQPFHVRALVASPGVVATVLFVGAALMAALRSAGPTLREPFLLLWLFPIVLVALCLWRFAGPRGFHVLLLPLGAAMLWSLVVSYTIIGGGK